MPALATAPRSIGALGVGWQTETIDYPLALAWSHDGAALYVIDAAGHLYCLDARSGALRWQREAHADGALALAVSPHDPLLVTAGKDGRVRLWNARDGESQAVFEPGVTWIEHLAWSADGQFFAAAGGRVAHIYARDGRVIARCAEHPSTISALAWSAPGEIVTTCYGQVGCWDASNGMLADSFSWQGSLISLALSHDHAVIACGSQDASVHFWRRANREDSEIRGYSLKPSVVAFDRHSRWLASNGGDVITLWDFAGNGPENTRPLVLSRHSDTVTAFEFAQRYDLLVSGARDGSVCLWSMTPQRAGSLSGGSLLGAAVVKLAWRPDQRALAALDSSCNVTCWRIRPEQALTTPLRDEKRAAPGAHDEAF
jgi:WD40 repeat protein